MPQLKHPKKTKKQKLVKAHTKESASHSIPERQSKELLDLMTKGKNPVKGSIDPKLIEQTKAINDTSFFIETFPKLLLQDYDALIKELLPILKKHKLMKLEIYRFKKWMDGEETDAGVAQKT